MFLVRAEQAIAAYGNDVCSQDARLKHSAYQLAAAILVVLVMNMMVPFAVMKGSDDSRYVQLARDIKCDGGTLYRTQPEASLHFAPGYPWLLSLFIGCRDMGWVPYVQRIYLGLTIAICSIWATTKFGAGTGWLAFGLLALNPALISSASMVSSETPHLPLYVAGFQAWFWFVKAPRIGPLLLCATLLALAAYVRSYGLLLAGFVPVLILIGLRECPWSKRLTYAALAALVWLCLLGPWAVRNHQLFGHAVPMTMTGHSIYSSWFPPGPKQFGMMANDEVTKKAAGIVDPFERDAFYRQATVRRILDDPMAALSTTVRKYAFYLMPFDWEFFGTYDAAGRLRPSLHYLYVFLVPFVGSYVWHRRRDREFWVGPMSPFLFGLIMTGLAYGIPRFRLCVEPFMTVFGAACLYEWIRQSVHPRVAVASGYFLFCVLGAYQWTRLVQ